MSDWYYAHDGEQKGPVPTSELQRLASTGEFDPESDLVWREGMNDWLLASKIPELEVLAPKDEIETVDDIPEEAPSPIEAAASIPVSPTPVTLGQPKTQGLAIASLICAILAIFGCFLFYFAVFLALAAVIMGHISVSRTKKYPETHGGKGVGITGLILGYLGIIINAGIFAFMAYLLSLSPDDIRALVPDDPEKAEELIEQLELIRKAFNKE